MKMILKTGGSTKMSLMTHTSGENVHIIQACSALLIRSTTSKNRIIYKLCTKIKESSKALQV